MSRKAREKCISKWEKWSTVLNAAESKMRTGKCPLDLATSMSLLTRAGLVLVWYNGRGGGLIVVD